jgi:iron complex transport system permease protein
MTVTNVHMGRLKRLSLLLVLLLLVLFVANISLGSVRIPFLETVSYLTLSTDISDQSVMILKNFRMPKALTAILVGATLGVSGLQMQTLFRNPLAGPSILGITAGAGLGVAIAIFLGVSLGSVFILSGMGRSWLLVLSAGLGSSLVLVTMAFASQRLRDSVSLLIIGLMFGTAAGAVVSILQFFSQAENVKAYVIWSFGALGSLSWPELSIFIPILVLNLLLALLLSKPLNALLLGEDYASSLGLNLKMTRILVIINTSLMAGTVTAFCGPIAFIGIALPHIARMIFHTTNHLLLTPLIILTGASLMLFFDIIAQLPGLEATLPINAITSLFGAPFVIFLILRRRQSSISF